MLIIILINISFRFFRMPAHCLVGRVFANGTGVTPKTFKMALGSYLLKTQQYKVRIKGKVEQSRERSIAHPYTSV